VQALADRIEALYAATIISGMQGNSEVAFARAGEARSLVEGIDDRRVQGLVAIADGFAASVGGDAARALTRSEDALAATEEPMVRFAALLLKGWALEFRGELNGHSFGRKSRSLSRNLLERWYSALTRSGRLASVGGARANPNVLNSFCARGWSWRIELTIRAPAHWGSSLPEANRSAAFATELASSGEAWPRARTRPRASARSLSAPVSSAARARPACAAWGGRGPGQAAADPLAAVLGERITCPCGATVECIRKQLSHNVF
jgi:hypothetical protein